MADFVKIAVDAMGGDNAPGQILSGCLEALSMDKDIFLYLAGDQAAIEAFLKGKEYDADRVEIVHASEVITNEEHPAFAIKKKRDSSMVIAQRLVREGKADAFVSAGSTGAVLVGGQVLVGRIKGIQRPALCPIIPTKKGLAAVIDAGANVDAKPSNLVQFAQMGSIYMENHLGVKNPRVGLLNIGAEDTKGNALVRETFPLLAKCPNINFIGSIEAREVPEGGADIIVCDAFSGNVMIKMYEGVANVMMEVIKKTLTKNMKTKLGAALIHSELKAELKPFDTSDYGAAPMLGVKGAVFKAHGNAMAKEFRIAVLACAAYAREGIVDKISKAVNENRITEEEE